MRLAGDAYDRPDTIYIVKPVGMDGPYKVGCTCRMKERLRDLSNRSPFELELVCQAPGTIETERRIHARLLPAHLRCEWFADGPEIQGLIAEMRSGTFDPDTLPAPIGVAMLIKRPVAA